MARLSLSITTGVRIDFPHVIASAETISQSCTRLRYSCDNVMKMAEIIGGKMQTQANDSARFVLGQTTEDLEHIEKELRDLQVSVEELVEKLKRLERLAAN